AAGGARISAELRGGCRRPAEAGLARQAGQSAWAMGFPEPARLEVIAVDEIPGVSGGRRRDTRPQQLGLGGSGGYWARPRGDGLVDCLTTLSALANSEFGHRRQVRYERAQVSPFRIGGGDEADPVVLAGAAIDAMGSVLVGSVAARLRRGRELGAQ